MSSLSIRFVVHPALAGDLLIGFSTSASSHKTFSGFSISKNIFYVIFEAPRLTTDSIFTSVPTIVFF